MCASAHSSSVSLGRLEGGLAPIQRAPFAQLSGIRAASAAVRTRKNLQPGHHVSRGVADRIAGIRRLHSFDRGLAQEVERFRSVSC